MAMEIRGAARDKILKWLDENEDRWYTATFDDIQTEADVSQSTLNKSFIMLLARKAKLRPIVVQNKRRKNLGMSPWRDQLTNREIAEIQRLYESDPNITDIDVAYATGRGTGTVRKYRPAHMQRRGRKQVHHNAKDKEAIVLIDPPIALRVYDEKYHEAVKSKINDLNLQYADELKAFIDELSENRKKFKYEITCYFGGNVLTADEAVAKLQEADDDV